MATTAGVAQPDHEWPISLVADASRGCVYGLLFPSAGLVRLNSDGTTTHLGRPAPFTKAAIYPGRCMWLGTNGRVYFTAGQDGSAAATGGTYDPAIYNKVWYWDPTTSTFGSQATWALNSRALDAKAEFSNPRVVYLMDEDFTIFKYSEPGGTPTFVRIGDLKGMTTEAIGFSWSFAVRPDQVHAYVIGSNGHFFRYNFDNPGSPRNFYGTIQAKDSFWADHFWFGGGCFDADGRFWVNAFHKSNDGLNARVVTIHPTTFVTAIQGTARASTGTEKGIRHPGGLAGMWYRIVPDMPAGNAPHDAWSGCAIAPDGTVYFSAHDHLLNSGLYAIKQASTASDGGLGRFVAPATAQTIRGTYVERNESGLEATGTFTVTVESDIVVPPPEVTCRADEYTTNKNTPIDMPVLSNDDEADIVSRVVTAPTNGTTTIVDAGKKIRYAPLSTFVGDRSFRYEGKRSSDGAVDEADILLHVIEPSAIPRKAWNTGGTSGVNGLCRIGLGNGYRNIAKFTAKMGTPTCLAGWPGGNKTYGKLNDLFGGDTNQSLTDYSPGGILKSAFNWRNNMQGVNCRQIIMWPGFPNEFPKAEKGKWKRFLAGGAHYDTWNKGWYAMGRRYVKECNNLRAGWDFKKSVITFDWESSGSSYPWQVGQDNEADYVKCWRSRHDAFREGANDEQANAGDHILIELRYSGHLRFSNTIANLYPGDDYVDILGASLHQDTFVAPSRGEPEKDKKVDWGNDATYGKEKFGYRMPNGAGGDAPGFDNVLEFAKKHNKPCGFDEFSTPLALQLLTYNGQPAARYPAKNPDNSIARICRYVQSKGADLAHIAYLEGDFSMFTGTAVANSYLATMAKFFDRRDGRTVTEFQYPTEYAGPGPLP